MANLRAKALAKRKPAQLEEMTDEEIKAMVDEDREINATDAEKGEAAGINAHNSVVNEANSAFKSGGKMNDDEFNRQSKARAEALSKKARKNK